MRSRAVWLIVALGIASHAGESAARQGTDDPVVRAAVEAFFATQQAEDVAGYLALWSTRAQRPQAASLQYIFDAGDDVFSEIAVTRVTEAGDQVRVRVTARRRRTMRDLRPDGTPAAFTSTVATSLTFVREGNALKLMREGSAADEMAGALLAAETAADRERLLEREPDLVNESLVLALSRLGDFAAQGTRYAAALPAYQRALEIARRIGDRRREGHALQNVATTSYFLRDFTAALSAYDARLTLERGEGNDEGIVGALLGIGSVRYALFEYSAALTNYIEVLPIQIRLDDQSGAATTFVTVGNIHYLQGDLAGAAEDYRRSRDLWRTLSNAAGEARALEGLGRALSSLGDYAGALEAWSGVLANGRARGDSSAQAVALQSVGEIHFRLGNLDVARQRFGESRTLFEATRDWPNVGRLWQAIGFTELVAARFGPAEQAYKKSAETCGAAQDRECAARAIVGLAFAQTSEEHYDEAVTSYLQGIVAFTGLGRLEDAARAQIGLAQAQRGRKDYDAALAAAGRARAYAVASAPALSAKTASAKDDVLWRAAVEQARALRRKQDAAGAVAAANDAIAAVQRIAEAALDRPGDGVPRDAVAAYAVRAVLQAEAGDAAGTLATLEARRVLGLRAGLARNEREIAAGMTPGERESERTSAAALVSLQLKLDHEQTLPKPDAARVAGLQQLVATATSARRQEQQRLFERLPDLRLRRGLLTAATAADLEGLLTIDGATFTELAIDDDDVVVVMAARRDGAVDVRAAVAPVARQVLAQRIARALDPGVLRSEADWRTAATELAAALPAGVVPHIASATHAIVIPDDVLWRVPFEALPTDSGLVVDRTAVRYGGSLTALLTTPATATVPSGPVLSVGAPELSAGVRERITATVPDWTLRAPEAAATEAAAVAGDAGEPASVRLLGEAATESAFRQRAPDASVIHLATPFRMNLASPLFSPLLMSDESQGGPDGGNDGVVEAREILNIRLKASVAILTDGAATSSRDVGSVETVHWAWQASGVPQLLLTRWAGAESASTTAMLVLASKMRAGESPGAAMQAARATLREQADTRAPFYWAGWMLVGR